MVEYDEDELEKVGNADDLYVDTENNNLVQKKGEDEYTSLGHLDDDHLAVDVEKTDEGYVVGDAPDRSYDPSGEAPDAATADEPASTEDAGAPDEDYVTELDDPKEVEGSDSLVVDDGKVYMEKDEGYKLKGDIQDGKVDIGSGVVVTEGDDGYEVALADMDYTTSGASSGASGTGTSAPASAADTAQQAADLEDEVRDHYDQQREQIEEIRQELEGLKEADEEESSGEFDSMEDLLKMHKVLDNSGLSEFKSIATAAYLINQYKSETDRSERANVVDELEDRLDSLEQGIYGTGPGGEGTDTEGEDYGDDEGAFGDLVASNEAETDEESSGFFERMKGYKDRLLGGGSDDEDEGRDLADDQATFDEYQDDDEESDEDVEAAAAAAAEEEGAEVVDITGVREESDGTLTGKARLDDGTTISFEKKGGEYDLGGTENEAYISAIEEYGGPERALEEPGLLDRVSSGISEYVGSGGGGYFGGLFGGGEEPEPSQEEIEEEREGFMDSIGEATGAAENVGEEANEAAGETIVDEEAAPSRRSEE